MILYNEKEIKQEKFGDGTLKMAVPEGIEERFTHEITWCYDNDAELFALWTLVNQIRDKNYPYAHISLEMPYIPHARQDRNVSNRFFTLKYFAKLINEMKFDMVKVLDPHSDVSLALINNVVTMNANLTDSKNIPDINEYTFMYPDNGAAKKYNANSDCIIGNKHRNAEGRITDYELINFKEGTKKVLIVDDIVSFGGTFVSAAKALREKGVEQVDLLVSHCESNIFKGEVFKYLDHVYTTDSILDLDRQDYEGYDPKYIEDSRLIIIKKFRPEKEKEVQNV